MLGALILASRLPVTERLFWHPHRRQEWRSKVIAIAARRRDRRRKVAEKAWRVARCAPHRVYVGSKMMMKRPLEAAGLR